LVDREKKVSRHPITVRRRRKASRAKKVRRGLREAADRMREVYNPDVSHTGFKPEPVTSKTQQKKVDRQEHAVQERAERKLESLDRKWGLGLGPVKARLKWMGQLFGGGG
jgi:hypothetical protein